MILGTYHIRMIYHPVETKPQIHSRFLLQYLRSSSLYTHIALAVKFLCTEKRFVRAGIFQYYLRLQLVGADKQQ